ncbi:hypothetical protein GCM10010172_49440 [Paractinoplanes ferrugineus]|nr:hypothetical protein [Actinoplanes ferrugineus]
MTGQQWRPVVAIGNHGLVLGLDADASWVVVDGEQVRGVALGANLMMLLPLLEQPHRRLSAAVAAEVLLVPPWDELLVFALGWPTEYWPGLALGWLEDGYPLAGVRNAVCVVKDDTRRSQPLRHRALRLSRGAVC